MKAFRQESVEAFFRKAVLFLEREETENHLMLGICSSLLSSPKAPEAPRYFWTIEDASEIQGAALWTPDFKPVLTRMPSEAVEALIPAMEKVPTPLNGVSGPLEIAETFSKSWTTRTGGTFRTEMEMTIRVLDRVADVSKNQGFFRPALPSDVPLLLKWVHEFQIEVGLQEPIDEEREVQAYVNQGRLYLWVVRGRPVSMAGFTGATSHGVRLNFVFTPPGERNKGYACSCVAELSRNILASGRKYSFLFADRANPISNHVYEKIGYREACTWALREFQRPSKP